MDSNGNQISSARDMEGEETGETGENDCNNRKRALEGSVSDVLMKKFKVKL